MRAVSKLSRRLSFLRIGMRELSEPRYVVQGTSSLLIRIEDTLKTFTAGHENCRLKLKFQDGRGSGSENLKRKRKHGWNPHSKDWNKMRKMEPSKRKRDAKKTQILQPQLPQTATEISSNWKALQVVRRTFKSFDCQYLSVHQP